jgi:hypothetical protein
VRWDPKEISLKVEVECNTTSLETAKIRALVGVIAVEVGVTHV